MAGRGREEKGKWPPRSSRRRRGKGSNPPGLPSPTPRPPYLLCNHKYLEEAAKLTGGSGSGLQWPRSGRRLDGRLARRAASGVGSIRSREDAKSLAKKTGGGRKGMGVEGGRERGVPEASQGKPSRGGLEVPKEPAGSRAKPPQRSEREIGIFFSPSLSFRDVSRDKLGKATASTAV